MNRAFQSHAPFFLWSSKYQSSSHVVKALTEYSQCPSLLYGPLVSTNVWELEYTGVSHCKQMENMRSHLSCTKLTLLLRYLSST